MLAGKNCCTTARTHEKARRATACLLSAHRRLLPISRATLAGVGRYAGENIEEGGDVGVNESVEESDVQGRRGHAASQKNASGKEVLYHCAHSREGH